MGEVRVERVAGRVAFREFLHLPWRIYADDPVWVPPLLADQKSALDPKRHPFHEHAEVEHFLARRDGRVVGRVSAIVNRLHNEFHDERTGFFGLFESVDDAGVARALLDTAEAWLRARGMTVARGPMNLSTNDELFSPGVLIDGFERPPVLMMGHNPPYYARLIEAAGYGKSKDLYSYWLEAGVTPANLSAGLERLAKRYGVTIRPIELSRFAEEVRLLEEIYNSAWERNWGFVPMTPAEFAHMARQLKPIVDPGLALVAEVKGEPVGFGVGLPDYNQALKHLNGRLFPFGIFKLLWHRRRIDAVRVLTLGLKPPFRRMGIDALICLRMIENAQPKGRARGEMSWILEDNTMMRRAAENMGGFICKTYRVYEKPLEA